VEEQTEKTQYELSKMIEYARILNIENKRLNESLLGVLKKMNQINEKTIAIIYRACFEILPSRQV
jgi:hypothetical protein